MDWSAVVLLLAERVGLPVLLLGVQGELLLASPAAEQALGLGVEDLGGLWLEHHALPGAAARARWYLEKSLVGALRRLELPLKTPRGASKATFDAYPVGRDAERGVLLVLERLSPIACDEEQTDYDYEVSNVSGEAPRLLRLFRPGFESKPGQGHCFEVLHGRTKPCEECPLAHGSGAEKPSVVVRSRPPHDYVVTSVTRRGDEARVSVRSLSSSSLSALMLARLDQLAAKARLSKRERSVFGYLMDGRAVEEIATELDISPRTVKFHQANVLQKLGADSRTDLMRLVF